MEVMSPEAAITQQAPFEKTTNSIDEIADLQLLLVGGGIGDTQL